MTNKTIYWLHTYNSKYQNAGVFMYQLIDEAKLQGEIIESVYIGGNIREYITTYKKLRKSITNHDIIHAQYGSFCGFFSSLLTAKKKILSLRGSDWYIAPEKKISHKVHNYIAKILTLVSLYRFDKVIVMSHRMKEEVGKRIKRKNIIVIPDGINLKKFFPMPQNEARKTIGEENNTNKWILFSTIHKDNCLKRSWLAEDSVKLLAKEFNDIELKVMTGIPHDKVNAFVNSCDVILLTSTHEGYPNIVKEGLACNVPFVSTDVSDLKLIAEKEPNCIVTNPDVEDISESLKKVLFNSDFSNLREYAKEMEISKVCNLILKTYE
jgi:teichuronic acid biosynthesis glycosyltransferase TuaC